MNDFNQRIIDEFRANGGFVSTAGFGRNLVLVHHVGARSGVERVAPLFAVRSDVGWLIAASKGGAPDHPGWYHNLAAHPETIVEVPGEGEVAVRAVELEGAERDAAWERFTAASDGFATYQARTSRVIPVVELRRR
ncbi:nitroreductase/quinone reductase family protein [Agromyces rhizosphaerae]|uniref:nitroreductase/quinone reductase family protein n=1 Tax=Agromyces rhizosphaerae TaxID=88374 RepID=UPI0024927446|nr:nitroreductase/quinone reductase family protein [Agromyces rhizosphaerae]